MTSLSTVVPELGGASLLAALVVAAAGMIWGVRASHGAAVGALASARRAAEAQFVLVTLAVVVLEYLLITSDFSVRYVASTSVSTSPLRYGSPALGALEGRSSSGSGSRRSSSCWWRAGRRRCAASCRAMPWRCLRRLRGLLVMMTAIASPFERPLSARLRPG